MTFDRRLLLLPLLTALAAPSIAQAQVADPVRGKNVFMRCMICHSVDPGVKKLGPSLAGIVGKKAGSMPGYFYSPAMKASGIVWTPKNLDAFLAKPQAVVKGTKMAFFGLPTPVDRANVIAYLKKPVK